jgi:DNA-binding NtrC family response regulator
MTETAPIGSFFGRLVKRVQRLAEAGKSVLIVGDTGTGKELLLREYTQHPKWKDRAAIINCTAIPSTLLESTLFGHEKGAFTGATTAKKGLIEAYDLIALDEIGDAPPEFHAKILRVFEDGGYQRLGNTRIQHEPVLFIAATNKPEALRPDLLWRFAARIFVPDIAQRREDLVDLLAQLSSETGICEMTERCLGFLIEEYPWLGNVREMRFLLELLAEQPRNEPIDLHDLPIVVLGLDYPRDDAKWGSAARPGRTWKLDESFPTKARAHFNVDPSYSQAFAEKLDRLLYDSYLNVDRSEEIQRDAVREIPHVLYSIRDTIAGMASPSLKAEFENAPTWDDAARRARAIWYKARLAEGKSRREIAEILGISPQWLGKQLVQHGLLEKDGRASRRK